MIDVTLVLNGRETQARVDDRLSLADFVREHAGLTAAHLGCEHGACGACTVLIDGEPARSCIVLAAMCDQQAVDTFEAFDDDAVMAALRRAFHELHALQCGFCTPGMLMTARDIIRRYSMPSRADIRRELSGQICRCTGYAGIVSAIETAAGELATRTVPDSPASP